MKYRYKLSLLKKIFKDKKKESKKFSYPLLTDGYSSSDLQEASKILLSERITMSKMTKKFEKFFANKIGARYALMVNSGSSANLLATFCLLNPYKKNRLKKGDECLVPALCWSTSLWPIVQAGLKPIFVDVNINTFTIDFETIKKSVTKKTKAVMLLNVLGNCSEMEKIKNFLRKKKIILIEDTCEALGSKYKNKYLGTFGEFGCFSFYPTKNLGCFGDGGAIVFKKNKYSEEIKSLRNHGSTKNYYHKYIGLNSRLDSIQGLILKLKLGEINKNLNLRIKNNNLYRNLLDNNHVNLHSQINQPMNVFPITVKDASLMNKIKSNLKKNKVGFGTYYPFGLQEFPISQLKQSKSDFKNTDYVKKNIVTIPCHSKISSEDIKKISNIINES